MFSRIDRDNKDLHYIEWIIVDDRYIRGVYTQDGKKYRFDINHSHSSNNNDEHIICISESN